MKTRKLIQELLETDLDAEVDVVFDDKLEDGQWLEISVVKSHKTSFGEYTIIELKAYYGDCEQERKSNIMECDQCGREWTAAMEDGATERLKCPDCGAMVQAPPQKTRDTSDTPTNSAMPKLPELSEVLAQLDAVENDPVADRVVEGVKVAYEFIARQLSA
jgi:DNA-directed RNA polymerase subunit RPC12/RpoP